MNLLKLEYTLSHCCCLSDDEPVDMFHNSNLTKKQFNTKIYFLHYTNITTTGVKSKLEQKKKSSGKDLMVCLRNER